MEPEGSGPYSQEPPFVPILKQMNSVHVTPIRPHPIYPGVLKPKLINSSEL
jgi:hypothetical protein